MVKRIVGVLLILVLAGGVLFNYIQQKNDSESTTANKYDVTGDTDTKGGMISSVQETHDIGDMAPDFELNTLSGEKLQLSKLRGKKVILNFWATWCPPCREEMPEMQRFYDDFNDEVEMVAVNLTELENKKENVAEYIEKYQYTYPIPLDTKAKVRSAYKIIAVPTTYFINQQGKITKIHPGPMDYDLMKEAIESM
ncbi:MULTISPECIES: TlpA disulfide reductase family protein [Clostridia]|uniref:TlpA family protein disulfide reductase n=1 Tax=Clostridia TaxID=186801 RepID=UPI000EA06171|nr:MULTISPECIES: TlpA disulfide reductase family protein [Clostridia]NBJ69907.1 TlpA family protein disulfide reductase [Roseburia sp. 1XD42-34]RKI77550.1 TlpA family protein disulfide reductase [Clostridium sp. 1xD42-85]